MLCRVKLNYSVINFHQSRRIKNLGPKKGGPGKAGNNKKATSKLFSELHSVNKVSKMVIISFFVLFLFRKRPENENTLQKRFICVCGNHLLLVLLQKQVINSKYFKVIQCKMLMSIFLFTAAFENLSNFFCYK